MVNRLLVRLFLLVLVFSTTLGIRKHGSSNKNAYTAASSKTTATKLTTTRNIVDLYEVQLNHKYDSKRLVSFESCVKLIICGCSGLLLAMASVTPRHGLSHEAYNYLFKDSVFRLGMSAVWPVLTMFSMFRNRDANINTAIDVFVRSLSLTFPMVWLVQAIFATVLRLGVLRVLEPDVFKIKSVPIFLLPWSLADNDYFPSRTTMAVMSTLNICFMSPIVEEVLKVVLLKSTLTSGLVASSTERGEERKSMQLQWQGQGQKQELKRGADEEMTRNTRSRFSSSTSILSRIIGRAPHPTAAESATKLKEENRSSFSPDSAPVTASFSTTNNPESITRRILNKLGYIDQSRTVVKEYDDNDNIDNIRYHNESQDQESTEQASQLTRKGQSWLSGLPPFSFISRRKLTPAAKSPSPSHPVLYNVASTMSSKSPSSSSSGSNSDNHPHVRSYLIYMLAASYGIKVADMTRRILLYTHPYHPNKAFYALARSVHPIRELCGLLTGLRWAARDMLNHKTSLLSIIWPAVVLNSMACFRGMKPVYVWQSRKPWEDVQLHVLHYMDIHPLNSPEVYLRLISNVLWYAYLIKVMVNISSDYVRLSREYYMKHRLDYQKTKK